MTTEALGTEGGKDHGVGDAVYVSWGGTGRAATLRRALSRAADEGRALLYLAILDPAAFGDLDQATIDLAKHELGWLLEAQLELARTQTGLSDVPVRVQVRAGDVGNVIIDAVGAVGPRTPVMIGAPLPQGTEDTVAELVLMLDGRLDGSVELITP